MITVPCPHCGGARPIVKLNGVAVNWTNETKHSLAVAFVVSGESDGTLSIKILIRDKASTAQELAELAK